MPTNTERPKIELRRYTTAFIDLLGLSNRLLEFDVALTGRLTDDQKKEIGKTITTIQVFRNSFKQFYEAFQSTVREEELGSAHPDALQIWASRIPPEPVIQTISDSVVVSIRVEGGNPLSQYFSLGGLFIGCAAAQRNVLGMGILSRGGIADGFGSELSKGEIMGAGLVSAYRLEHDIAVYPRIVVDDYILRATQPPDRDDGKYPPAVYEMSKGLWEDMMGRLSRDKDGRYFVDFLGRRLLSECISLVPSEDRGKRSAEVP